MKKTVLKKVYKSIAIALLSFLLVQSFYHPVLTYAASNSTLDNIINIVDLYFYPESYTGLGLKNFSPYTGVPSENLTWRSFEPVKVYSSDGHGGGGSSRPGTQSQPIMYIDEPDIKTMFDLNYNTTTHEYNPSVYNPQTNLYETTNNIYYDNSVDNYIFFETTNNYIFYSFEYTYYSIYVAPITNPTDGKFFQVYYELPDGRSSYNLTPEDVKGVVFNYDVINYNKTVLENDVIGLWHLDGTSYNSVDNTLGYDSGYFSNSIFNGGYQFNPYAEYCLDTLSLYIDGNLPSKFTLDFWLYVPSRTPMSIVKGYPSNVVPYVPFDGDRWVHVIYCSEDNTVSFAGQGFYSLSNDSFFSDFLSFGNSNINFKMVPRSSTVSFSGTSYTEVVGLNYCVDEVRLRTGTDKTISESPRREPYDLSFAYTIPTKKLVGYNEYTVTETVVSSGYHNILETRSPSSFSYGGISIPAFSYSTIAPISIDNLSGAAFYVADLEVPLRLTFNSLLGSVVYGFSDSLNVGSGNATFFSNPSVGTVSITPDRPYFFIFAYDNSSANFLLENKRDMVYEIIHTIKEPIYEDINNNCIAIQSPVPLRNTQIGGIRPTNPSDGDTFISLKDSRASSIQTYFNGIWNSLDGAVFYNGRWYDLLDYDFSTMMLVSDKTNDQATYIINNYYYNGSGGSGSGAVVDMAVTNTILTSISSTLNTWFAAWAIDNVIDDIDTSSGAKWYDVLLPLVYVLYLFLILVSILLLVANCIDYLFHLISIPAFASNLDENFTKAFDFLRGDTDDPFYVLSVGGLYITCFDFMVLIFEIAFLGTFIMIIRYYINKIHVPVYKE